MGFIVGLLVGLVVGMCIGFVYDGVRGSSDYIMSVL